MSDATSALEQKWAQEEASKSPLEKAYEKVGSKKTDKEKLNPEKLSSELLDQLPDPTGWRGTATNSHGPRLCVKNR